jgi:hypothetical protein
MKRMELLVLAAVLAIFAQPAQAGWTSAIRLTWNSGLSVFPDMAVDSFGNLHVVWVDTTPGNEEIYYKKSPDGGATWTTAKRLTMTPGSSGGPSITADSSGNPHVVWYDNTLGSREIYYMKSTDGGATWTTAKRLTWTADNSWDPAIVAGSSGKLYLVWYEETPGNWNIYFKCSTDGGTTWTTNKRLTWTSGDSLWPSIAVDSSGNLHVVWSHNPPSMPLEIYYRKSTDGGATWTTSKRLTWTAQGSEGPAIAADSSGHLHVVWYDSTPGNVEIYYKASLDGGGTWTASKRLISNSGDSYSPDIAVDSSGNPHVVWFDDTPGNREIYYKKSTDGGGTWGSAQRLTSNSADSEYPAIAVDTSGNPHLVWGDSMLGGWEIYHKTYIK